MILQKQNRFSFSEYLQGQHMFWDYTARLKNVTKNVQADNNVQNFLSMSHSNYYENKLKYYTEKWGEQLHLINKEIQMLTPEKAYPGSLRSRMRAQSCVLTVYADCYTFLTSNIWQRNSSFQAFSCKHLKSSWVLLSHFYIEIKVKSGIGKSESLLQYLSAD